jgi:hypothetical protein
MVPADEFESYVRDMKKNENFGFDQQFKVGYIVIVWITVTNSNM